MDYTVHGILQVRTLEWVAISSPGDLPKTGVKPGPRNQVDSLPSEPPGKPLILLRGQIKKWGGGKQSIFGDTEVI